MFIYGPGTRVSVVGQIRSPLFLLGGYGFYLMIALYLMGSHHSHYLGSGELRNVQSVFVYGPGTRVSVVGRIRSPLFLLGGYGFYLIIALYLIGSHHSHYLGSGELRNVQSDALCSY